MILRILLGIGILRSTVIILCIDKYYIRIIIFFFFVCVYFNTHKYIIYTSPSALLFDAISIL